MMIEKSSGLGFRDRSSFLAYWFPMREKAVTGHNTWRTLRGWADGQFLPVLPAFFPVSYTHLTLPTILRV